MQMREQELLPRALESCLPAPLAARIVELGRSGQIRADELTEIRIRLGQPASLTAGGNNRVLDFRATAADMGECVARLCRGSVYAHSDTIREGYIRGQNGWRIGVCGIVSDDGGNLREITSLNIRIPHAIRGVCESLLKRCLAGNRLASMLVYSPPGEGKTTLLRDLASRLASDYSRRVALLDTRGELYMAEMFRDGLCDVLTGYPRAKGIEIATRTLSPQVIVCDELGDAEEARAILAAQNTGVPMIASAHASQLGELLRRPNIRLLHEHGVFDQYVGFCRERVGMRLSRCYRFTFATRREADEAAGCFV